MTGKRVCDVLVGGVLLVGTAPLLAAGALAVHADGLRPVLWRSTLLGRNGEPFTLLILRTMRAQEGASASPRPGRIIRVVRSLSLDHLPMLVNVARGDLSLVGPRPMEPDQVDLADPRWRHVLTVRPGLISYAILRLGHVMA